MQLPFLSHKSKSDALDREYLLALEISPKVVKCAVWSVINAQTQVVAVGDTAQWDDISAGSLISASDIAISSACERMGSTKPSLKKVILGLGSSWVISDKISETKMPLIKALSQKLDLIPVGFVVTCEAVMRYVQHTESTPPTAILLGFWPNTLDITLVRLGKSDGIVEVVRSQNLTDDVVEGLSRFPKVDMLPSRMLLYDSGIDLEDIKQLLLSYPWLSPIKKFGFLHFPKIEILPSDFTIRAIAMAGGMEVAVSLGLLDKTGINNMDETPAQNLNASDFGFGSEEIIITTPEIVEKPKITLPIITIPKPDFTLPTFSLSFSFKPALITIFLITGLLTIVGSVIWFLPKATINLGFQSRTIDHNFVADLAVSELDATASLTESTPTTGSKLVGDRAGGTVTIVNGMSLAKSFPRGTTISSPSGLKFTFDKDAQVASASGVANNKIYGESKVNITAAQVGSDSNLSSNTTFQIGSLATFDIIAKNDVALSGGTSRQVKAVAKNDVENLRAKLVENLKAQVKQQLLDKASTQTLINDSITISTVGEDLDYKIGDAADSIQLKLTIKAKAMVIKTSDIDQASKNAISGLVPAGFEIQSITPRVISVKKNVVSVSISAKLTPLVNTSEILKNVSGKSLNKATEYLHTIPGISKIEYVISPPLPVITSRLPFRSSRISIGVYPL